ncbi:MAG: alanine--tRNA ligase [Candidatus Magasanikbacteria bacterium]|nr:alanine--tRNA ligase [Candidatus Magasanikbacteria bacterium]
MLTSKELRQKYLDFFASKGHAIIPSASLVPDNDPTVLFTTAGMHPLVPYLMGQKHPSGSRLVNVQKCIRTQDIDEVGDNRHDTFFEMLGNWSLGDYFKKEAIEWSWEFLTSSKWLNIDKKKLAVTVFTGDNDAPRDDESAGIWKSFGVPEERIGYLPKKNNWWGPAGQTGPCGPDTEMFYWKGATDLPPAGSNPATDEDNWLEIWNDVFMQYNKKADGTFEPLKQQNVDTGMGLERTLVVLNGLSDVFQIDTFWPLIQKIQDISGREYVESKDVTKSMRIVADHLRTATMIMGDDAHIAPSNVERGYIVRRLIRRAVRRGRLLGIKENFCDQIASEIIALFGTVYPELTRNKDFVTTEMAREESKFRNTIEQGLKELNKLIEKKIKEMESAFAVRWPPKDPIAKSNYTINAVTPQEAFDLYQSHGFPLELINEELAGYGLFIDAIEFDREFKKHQELSRTGAEQKFAGGLADHSEISTKYHTATHLLHAALQRVLGPHAMQRGSNITQERMRFDFAHPEKMTSEQVKQAEDMVNAAIQKDYPVSWQEMSFEEAKEKGAIGLFEDKYQARVKVYTVGDTSQKAFADPTSPTYSREVCGGPHVEHTGTIGHFKIVKEEAVAAGIRRIKAIVE